MGPKIFTPRDAGSLLPAIEDVLVGLDRIKGRLRQLKGKIEVLEMLWGDEVGSDVNPDRREYQHYLSEIEKSKAEYEQCTRRLADLEVLTKSVEAGLVDFYGVIDGRLVFLCWKRGEKSVEYYHHLEDGFAGRQPIPSEEPAK